MQMETDMDMHGHGHVACAARRMPTGIHCGGAGLESSVWGGACVSALGRGCAHQHVLGALGDAAHALDVRFCLGARTLRCEGLTRVPQRRHTLTDGRREHARFGTVAQLDQAALPARSTQGHAHGTAHTARRRTQRAQRTQRVGVHSAHDAHSLHASAQHARTAQEEARRAERDRMAARVSSRRGAEGETAKAGAVA
jgi:hypothetical protein